MKKSVRTFLPRLTAMALLIYLLLGCCMPVLASQMADAVEQGCHDAWNNYFSFEAPDEDRYFVGQTYTFRIVPDKSLKKTESGRAGSVPLYFTDGHTLTLQFVMIEPWIFKTGTDIVDGETIIYPIRDEHQIPNIEYQIRKDADDAFLIEITPQKAGHYNIAVLPRLSVAIDVFFDFDMLPEIILSMDVIDKKDLITVSSENTGLPNTAHIAVSKELDDGVYYALSEEELSAGLEKGTDLNFFIYAEHNFKIDAVAAIDANGRTLYSSSKLSDGYADFTLKNVQGKVHVAYKTVPSGKPYGKMLYPFDADTTSYADYCFTDEYPLYEDVKPDNWFFEPVFQLWKASIIDLLSFEEYAPASITRADADGSCFYPGMNQTRGLTAQILFNSISYLNLPYESVGSSPFTDVKLDAPYYYAVLWAADSGAVTGFPGDVFKPDNGITREQMCTIMLRLAEKAGLELPAVKEAAVFADAGKISDWAADAVKTCQAAGIVGGYPDGSFKPKNTISNAEACVMIYRFLSLIPK